MAEDGTGGLVYLKRVDGVAHVFVSRYRRRSLAGADPGRHRTALRGQLAADRRLPTAVSSWSCGRRRSPPRAERARRRAARRRRSAPAASPFGRAIDRRPQHRRRHGHEPRPGDELDRAGGRGLSRRATNGASDVPLLRPGDVVEEVRVAHFDGERWSNLGAVNRDPGVSMRPPTQPTPRRSRSARPATASSSGRSRKSKASRASGRGACSAATLDYVLPVSATSFDGAPIEADADAPSVAFSLARPGRGRLPAARRPGLAAAGAARSS